MAMAVETDGGDRSWVCDDTPMHNRCQGHPDKTVKKAKPKKKAMLFDPAAIHELLGRRAEARGGGRRCSRRERVVRYPGQCGDRRAFDRLLRATKKARFCRASARQTLPSTPRSLSTCDIVVGTLKSPFYDFSDSRASRQNRHQCLERYILFLAFRKINDNSIRKLLG